MEIVFSIEFIAGIVLVLFGIILLYLFKQGKTKLVVQDQVRLTIRSSTGYFFILYGFIAIAIKIIANIFPGFPSWGSPVLTTILLGATVHCFLIFRLCQMV